MSDAEHFDPGFAVMRWAFVVTVQCDRVFFAASIAAEAKQRGDYREWEDALHMTQADRHFLLVAAHNLVRAINASDLGRLPGGLDERIKLFRDVLEHWDEYEARGPGHRGSAGRKYRAASPYSHPLDDVRFTADEDLEIGGGLRVSRIRQLAADLLAWMKYPHARVFPPVPGPVPVFPLEDSE